MGARHFYRYVEGDPVEEVPNVLRWAYVAGEKAEEGEAGSWEVFVDDPDMTADFVGHRRWLVYEDASDDANELLVDGIVTAVRVAHTGGDVTGPAGRVWTIEIADLNTLFTYRVMTGSDSQFPDDQTDVDRVLQVANSEEMGYFDDLSFVFSGDTVAMDEYNGRGSYTGQIIDQCAQETGKNWYIYSTGTIAGGADIGLWYGFDGEDAYTSPLSLSNDPADLDMPAVNAGTATVYPIGADTELRRDYGRQYSGAYGEFQGGAKYIPDDENPYDPGITLSGRDIVHPAPEIKTRSRMKRRLLRILRDHATPDQVVKTTVTLPANKATQLKAGMRVAFKATHLPDYETAPFLRIMSATPKPVGQKGGEDVYEIALEMQGPGVVVTAATCSTALVAAIGNTDTGLESGGTTASVATSVPGDGYVLAVLAADNGNTPNSEDMGDPSGYTVIDNQPDIGRMTYSISYKSVSSGTATASASFTAGFASVGAWAAAQAWLPWGGLSIVQETVPGVGPTSDTFDGDVTPGNTVLLFAFNDREEAPTVGGTSGPTTGWTQLFHAQGGTFRGDGVANITCWARCVASGDGRTYQYTPNGALGLMTPVTYVVEIAT